MVRSPYVFPASRGDRQFQGTPRIWEKIRKEAGLDDVRIHDLRHTYASVAVDQGYSPQEIGRFLGHKSPAATARYSHLRNDPLRQKANLIGDYLSSLTGSGRKL
jgi:integrase